jgi:hypothetical protein
VAAEFFIDVHDKENQIVIDQALLNFGFVPRGGFQRQTVRITNRTNGKVGRLDPSFSPPAAFLTSDRRNAAAAAAAGWLTGYCPLDDGRGWQLQRGPGERGLGALQNQGVPGNVLMQWTTCRAPETSSSPMTRLQVLFQPQQENVYYSRALEVLIYLKSQRSFRLVNDPTMTPPWLLNISAAGRWRCCRCLCGTVSKARCCAQVTPFRTNSFSLK